MNFFKSNKGRGLGGIIGALAALIFIRYWYHAFSELASTLIIIFLILTGEFLGNYIYKKQNKNNI